MDRAALDVDTLLRIVLVLVIVWLALRVLGELLHIAFGYLPEILALAVVVLIVLWLWDRI